MGTMGLLMTDIGEWVRRISPGVVLLVALTSCHAYRTDSTEVRAAISEFSSAFSNADTARLRVLLTPDYVHVNGGSGEVLDRERWLNWVGTRRGELDAGQYILASYELGDVDIRMYGNAAVVTGTVHSTGMEHGSPFESRIRFTNTWVRWKGRWRRAGFHDSPVSELPF